MADCAVCLCCLHKAILCNGGEQRKHLHHAHASSSMSWDGGVRVSFGCRRYIQQTKTPGQLTRPRPNNHGHLSVLFKLEKKKKSPTCFTVWLMRMRGGKCADAFIP